MKPIVALVADLIFGSKITATAAIVGAPVRLVRRFDELRLAADSACAILLDLTVGDGDPVELLRELKAAHPDLQIVAFLPHVAIELAARAREAGANRVLPRSKFSADLPDILRALSSTTADGADAAL